MLRTMLAGISAAAASPLAFAAYAMALLVWGLIAWRTQRNRTLLAHLQKLPHNDRLNALRAEMGHVELKEGLSPEQWLRSKIQTSLLVAFSILCVTGIVVFSIWMSEKPIKHNVSLTLYLT